MTLVAGIFLFALILSVMVHTVSYALWNWKEKNKMGAMLVFLLCLATIAFQAYMLFFRS